MWYNLDSSYPRWYSIKYRLLRVRSKSLKMIISTVLKCSSKYTAMVTVYIISYHIQSLQRCTWKFWLYTYAHVLYTFITILWNFLHLQLHSTLTHFISQDYILLRCSVITKVYSILTCNQAKLVINFSVIDKCFSVL